MKFRFTVSYIFETGILLPTFGEAVLIITKMSPIAAVTTNLKDVEDSEVKNECNEENGEAKPKIILAKDIGTDLNFRGDIVWWNVFLIGSLHLFGMHGAYLVLSAQISWMSILFGKLL